MGDGGAAAVVLEEHVALTCMREAAVFLVGCAHKKMSCLGVLRSDCMNYIRVGVAYIMEKKNGEAIRLL